MIGLRANLGGRAGSLGVMPLLSGSILIPDKFLGMHVHHYPENPFGGSPDPEPAFSYGTFRTHDSGANWRSAHTGVGAFDWDFHDAVINYHYSLGHQIIYTFYYTPEWAASPNNILDPDGTFGGSAPPSDDRYATEFVEALLSRYNSGGVRKIAYLELWNEPTFEQNGAGYWLSTAERLVQLNVKVANAARAVDPSILIMSPGFFAIPYLAEYLAAIDPVSGVTTGMGVVDCVAFHCYSRSYYGASSVYDGTTSGPTIKRVREAVVSAGGSSGIDVHIGEWGILDKVAELDWFFQLPALERKRMVARTLAVSALNAVKSSCVYSYNSTLAGDLISDTQGVISAVEEINAALPGKTITDAYIDQNGRITLTAGGAVYAW